MRRYARPVTDYFAGDNIAVPSKPDIKIIIIIIITIIIIIIIITIIIMMSTNCFKYFCGIFDIISLTPEQKYLYTFMTATNQYRSMSYNKCSQHNHTCIPVTK